MNKNGTPQKVRKMTKPGFFLDRPIEKGNEANESYNLFLLGEGLRITIEHTLYTGWIASLISGNHTVRISQAKETAAEAILSIEREIDDLLLEANYHFLKIISDARGITLDEYLAENDTREEWINFLCEQGVMRPTTNSRYEFVQQDNS